MIFRLITAALFLGLAASAAADTPNIEPGLWEYNNKMSFSGDIPIPDQEQTSEECITSEDIAKGEAFLDDVEECEIIRQDLRRDGMNYVMTCSQAEGMEMRMEAEMDFNGDTASGNISGTMETPMGAMAMNITMTGRRIGDCPAQ